MTVAYVPSEDWWTVTEPPCLRPPHDLRVLYRGQGGFAQCRRCGALRRSGQRRRPGRWAPPLSAEREFAGGLHLIANATGQDLWHVREWLDGEGRTLQDCLVARRMVAAERDACADLGADILVRAADGMLRELADLESALRADLASAPPAELPEAAP